MAANEYTISRADEPTMGHVAHRVYGSTDHTSRLTQANGHVNDPNNVPPGTKIAVPRGAAARKHPQGT